MEYNFSTMARILKCKVAFFSSYLFLVSVDSTSTDTNTKPEVEILTDTNTSIGCLLLVRVS